ncbi:MAG: 4Fe-4S dicluster domain-containing protein [Fibrobacterota bacterium]
MKLSTFRQLVQWVFFLLFLLLFFLTTYPFALQLPVRLFLQSDPLMAVVAMIAGRAFISTMLLGLGVLVLSLIVGRLFCGYVCPLGTLNDLMGRFVVGKKGRKEGPEPRPGRGIKYFILAGVLAAALLGADLLHFFSPLAITPRFFTLVFFPVVTGVLSASFDLLIPFFTWAGLDALSVMSWQRFYFTGALSSLLLMGFILGAVFWQRRFWCSTLCPAGALLGLASRTALFRRVTNADACNHCGRCANVCDMRAITSDFVNTVPGECTLCGDCVSVCNKGAVRLAFAAPRTFADTIEGSERRWFLLSAGAGLAAASLLKAAPQNKNNLQGALIRPPGSLPESDFLARCARCGACMKSCKTNGLQPCGLEAGLDGLWTPRLVSRIGGCEEKCNMCGYACPTQAIRALPLEEKRFVKIGTGVIDRSRCIAWEQDRLCLICDEICPYDAIEFRNLENAGTKMNRPVVLANKCTGCGLCETRCPIAGRSAIEVYSIGEERKTHGSYVTDEKRRLREVKSAPAFGIPGEGGEDEGVPEGFSR